MPSKIENYADSESRSVVRFLTAKITKPRDIHTQISEIYGVNAMGESMVRKRVRMFKEGRENVNDEPRRGRPSLVSDDLINKVDIKEKEDTRFTLSSLSSNFPEISRSLLHEIVTDHLGYRKVCSRRVPKQLTQVHKDQQAASALTFLTCYNDERDDFLTHIVTGDETWLPHSTPESKQQSMQWKHTDSPQPKTEKFK
ncbi:protein GVQW3-like [Aplysia californica]|uniref:Protein GVQW3-like n=1 Tax=Aplysia californica TaxID=6500 RepID=A0ABM0JKA2_APLCA|nr:protein GVQW3-like [Aplysia californica]